MLANSFVKCNLKRARINQAQWSQLKKLALFYCLFHPL